MTRGTTTVGTVAGTTVITIATVAITGTGAAITGTGAVTTGTGGSALPSAMTAVVMSGTECATAAGIPATRSTDHPGGAVVPC